MSISLLVLAIICLLLGLGLGTFLGVRRHRSSLELRLRELRAGERAGRLS